MNGPSQQALDLRPARPSDAPAVAALVRAAYAKYVSRISREPKPMTADYEAVIRDHQVWVLDGAEGLIAVLELIPGRDHLLVENVAVRPTHQGRGLGRKLLAFAEAEARRQGFAEVRLYTNERFVENIVFYSRIGYRETGRHAYKGSALVFMSKRVDPPVPASEAAVA